MTVITNFNQKAESGDFLDYIPDHTMEALDHYFMKGWEPGGFLEAMIVEDYKLALIHADLANKQRFWYIAYWLMIFAPKRSVGSNEAMANWIVDKDGIRSAYVVEAEKDYEWRTLGGRTTQL